MTLKSNLPRLRKSLTDALDRGVGATAQRVKEERDRLVPVDTGKLKASGKVEKTGEAEYVVSEGEGIPDARAAYTEYGTSRQAAQPHMTPAARAGAQAMPGLVAAEIAQAVKEAAL
jgi:HK97 gp10 family phage protein